MQQVQQRAGKDAGDQAVPDASGSATQQSSVSQLFFARARVVAIFVIGFLIGGLTLSVFASEFSSLTSLRPTTLQTIVDPLVVVSEDGATIVKAHVQATNFVKPPKNGKLHHGFELTGCIST
jgi:hypothetical protein